MRSPDVRIIWNIRLCQKRISIWYCTMKQDFAAEDFHNRLQIPFIELRRLYQIDKIENQYHALGNALGVAFYDEKYKKQAEDALEKFRQKCPDASFAIGECLNADPFDYH